MLGQTSPAGLIAGALARVLNHRHKARSARWLDGLRRPGSPCGAHAHDDGSTSKQLLGRGRSRWTAALATLCPGLPRPGGAPLLPTRTQDSADAAQTRDHAGGFAGFLLRDRHDVHLAGGGALHHGRPAALVAGGRRLQLLPAGPGLRPVQPAAGPDHEMDRLALDHVHRRAGAGGGLRAGLGLAGDRAVLLQHQPDGRGLHPAGAGAGGVPAGQLVPAQLRADDGLLLHDRRLRRRGRSAGGARHRGAERGLADLLADHRRRRGRAGRGLSGVRARRGAHPLGRGGPQRRVRRWSRRHRCPRPRPGPCRRR